MTVVTQDITHIIFRCRLTRAQVRSILLYITEKFPQQYAEINFFPVATRPTSKLYRIVLAFFKSLDILL